MYNVDKGKYHNSSQDITGRPEDYPFPDVNDERLFFIQRNQNKSTVIYEINKSLGGLVNLEEPLLVYWVAFDESNNEINRQEINLIQKKLAYGYNFEIITNELIKIQLVSYDAFVMYLTKVSGQYKILTKIENEQCILQHIYVHADETGIFPQVKFAEIFCKSLSSKKNIYQKIIFDQ